jgi:hypothetical protein
MRLGVQLEADGDQLRISAPRNVVTEGLKAALNEEKSALLFALKHPNTPRAVLIKSRFGSLTFGGLRDALVIQTGCPRWQAELAIEASLEVGTIVGPDALGLFRAKKFK